MEPVFAVRFTAKILRISLIALRRPLQPAKRGAAFCFFG
jgi:hypothetical protein